MTPESENQGSDGPEQPQGGPPPSGQPQGDPEYKVYRSRRGPSSWFRTPDLSKLRDRARRRGGDRPEGAPAPGIESDRPGRSLPKRILKWVAILAGVWLLISVGAFAVSSQLQKWKLADSASDALDPSAFLLGSPQTILVIGTDARSPEEAEPGAEVRKKCLEQQAKGQPPSSDCQGFRADTLMLVRAGGGKFRKLSIPRDVLAEVPPEGTVKINSAYAYGGAGLQIKVVERLLGIDINNVVIVDFEGFENFIDAIGGVTVDLPNKPCADIAGGSGGGQGGITIRLPKGESTLDGAQALAYSRIRKPSDCPGPGKSEFSLGYDDLDRAAAQQRVLNGIKSRLASPLRLPYNFIKGPIIGWTAPQAFVSNLGALSMPQLVLSSVVAGSGDTDVLCGGDNSGCAPDAAGIEVPQSERQRAVDALLE